MKKKLYFITALLLATVGLSLSSCLKDNSHYIDFGSSTPVVEFNLGGMSYFNADNIQSSEAIDTIQFAVSVTTAKVPTTPTTINIEVDNSIITSYVAANPAIPYQVMPTANYTLSTDKVQIPANQRVAIVTLYVYMTLINTSNSYMIPIRITGSNPSYTISGNQGIHYFHFIGNDFAGTYTWDYTRTPASGNFTGGTATVSPISPTEASFPDNYYTGLVTYDFTFTKTGTGSTATYTNLNIVVDAASVASQLTPNGISVSTAATFVDPATGLSTGLSTLPGPYTYTQVLQLLDFSYSVFNGSANRTMVDYFYNKH
jgi:hypothetical protein